MSAKKSKPKPKQRRFTIALGESMYPKVEAIQSHYGHQTIAETVRFLVYQGVNQEVARQAQTQNAANMDVLREFNETMRQMMENPNLPGILDNPSTEPE